MNHRDEIIKIIASISILEETDIGEEDTLSNIGIDSLKAVELIIALEDGFRITFEDSDLDPARLTTVKSIIDLVEKYLK